MLLSPNSYAFAFQYACYCSPINMLLKAVLAQKDGVLALNTSLFNDVFNSRITQLNHHQIDNKTASSLPYFQHINQLAEKTPSICVKKA